jgi:reactive intermediate/imine deaminase
MSGYNAVLARNTENAPKGIGPYSQTVAFSHYNNLSAQLPIDAKSGKLVAGGVKEQAKQCFKNIKAILDSIDHVMSDVVRITVFVKNIKDIDAVDEVYKTFFPTYVPTQTIVALQLYLWMLWCKLKQLFQTVKVQFQTHHKQATS